jgi:23S rRNA-/tRNA-specific pseudouridylate synthase
MTDFTYHVPPPCDEPIDMVYVDEHLLVVSKPSGLLSVPGRFVKDCVINV